MWRRTAFGRLPRADRRLILGGLALETGLLAFCLLSGAWRGSPWLIPSFLIPAAIFMAVVAGVLRGQAEPATRATAIIILAFAALYHLTLLLTPHPLSNDLYRYLWDGKMLANGINPYTYPPAAPELAPLRDTYWELIFNRDVSTGYPPLVEVLFAGVYALRLGPFGYRLLAALCSLGVSAALIAVLRALEMDARRAVIYAWSPLVALEFANSAHLDAMAILMLVLAFLMHVRGRARGAALFLALGGQMKFFPAVLAPFWGRRWGWQAWLIFVAVFALPWLPFVAGGTPFTGLAVFAERGEFNASLYTLIHAAWARLLDPGAARLVARLSCAALVALAVGVLALRHWRSTDPRAEWRVAAGLMGWSLLLSPVVHPWYICWMLAFITVEWRAAWLVLSGSVIFARHVYLGYEATGIWQEARSVRWLVYVPFYAVLMWGVVRDLTPARLWSLLLQGGEGWPDAVDAKHRASGRDEGAKHAVNLPDESITAG